ncbi:11401_t:CDS:1, partial [Cetraspora pellucida]
APLTILSPTLLEMLNMPLNMFSLDNTQASQAILISQLLLPLSILKNCYYLTVNELDIPDFFQLAKKNMKVKK